MQILAVQIPRVPRQLAFSGTKKQVKAGRVHCGTGLARIPGDVRFISETAKIIH